jgi:hypothetical protein
MESLSDAEKLSQLKELFKAANIDSSIYVSYEYNNQLARFVISRGANVYFT